MTPAAINEHNQWQERVPPLPSLPNLPALCPWPEDQAWTQPLPSDWDSLATIIVRPVGHILCHTGAALLWLGGGSLTLPMEVDSWLRGCMLDASDRNLRLRTVAGEIEIQAVKTASARRILLVLTLKSAGAIGPRVKNYRFTARESEVAHWICQGKTNAEIAAILGVSPRTVHKHVEHILDKTNASSRLALTALLNGKEPVALAR
ncbi:MAG TPA: helix-turn-helix transcriptional regulator [Verrucomicrobiae bacterium]